MGRINSVIKLRESVLTLTAVEHDELTGIYTRQAFFYHTKVLLKAKAEEKFHLVVADIRDFKLINSSYGDKIGDQVLCYLARTYAKMMPHGLISRYGSDQFVCLAYGDMDLSLDIMKRVTEEIARTDTPATHYLSYGDGFLKYSNDGASYVNVNSDVIWNQSYADGKSHGRCV